jgi:hypothetical protein
MKPNARISPVPDWPTGTGTIRQTAFERTSRAMSARSHPVAVTVNAIFGTPRAPDTQH